MTNSLLFYEKKFTDNAEYNEFVEYVGKKDILSKVNRDIPRNKLKYRYFLQEFHHSPASYVSLYIDNDVEPWSGILKLIDDFSLEAKGYISANPTMHYLGHIDNPLNIHAFFFRHAIQFDYSSYKTRHKVILASVEDPNFRVEQTYTELPEKFDINSVAPYGNFYAGYHSDGQSETWKFPINVNNRHTRVLSVNYAISELISARALFEQLQKDNEKGVYHFLYCNKFKYMYSNIFKGVY